MTVPVYTRGNATHCMGIVHVMLAGLVHIVKRNARMGIMEWIAKIAVAVRMEGLVTMSLGHASAPQAGQDPFVRSLVQKAHTALPAVTSVPVKMVDTVTLSMGSVSVLLVGREMCVPTHVLKAPGDGTAQSFVIATILQHVTT